MEKTINNETNDDDGSSSKLVLEGVSEKTLLSTGIRVGTLIKTKNMERFISKTRSDGLHVLDLEKILDRIDLISKFLSRLNMKKVVVYSSREYAFEPIKKFCELTDAIKITGRFMPGTFTNPIYPGHLDAEAVIIVDPNLDSQAINEASTIGIPIISLCDTDNISDEIDIILPSNNRGRKSLACVFWCLCRQLKLKNGSLKSNQNLKYSIDDFETKLESEN